MTINIAMWIMGSAALLVLGIFVGTMYCVDRSLERRGKDEENRK